jgi:hypothetical protein
MITHITRHFPYYLLLFLTLILADGAFTNLIVQNGYGTEVNPILSPLVGGGLLAVKCLGIVILAAFLSQWYYSKTRVACLVLGAGLTLYGLLFIWNAGILYLFKALG